MVHKKALLGKLRKPNKLVALSIGILLMLGVFVYIPSTLPNLFLSSQVISGSDTTTGIPTTDNEEEESVCSDPQNESGTKCGESDDAEIYVKKTSPMTVYRSICQPRPSEPFMNSGTTGSLGLDFWENRSAWYQGVGNMLGASAVWELKPGSENDFNEGNRKFQEAMDDLSERCGNVARENINEDKEYIENENIGYCKGCESGGYGCVNPLGQGKFQLEQDDSNAGKPMKGSPAILEQISRDEWNTCYRAYCEFDGTAKKIEVVWSCGECVAGECTDKTTSIPQEDDNNYIAYADAISTTTSGTGSGTIARITTPGDPAVLRLTAIPQSGSKFTGWTGGGCTGTVPCVLVLSKFLGLVNLKATFELVQSGLCGATNNSCARGTPVDKDDNMTTRQYVWSCDGIHGGSLAICTAPMPPMYTLNTLKIGNGSITSSTPGINCGTDCTEKYVQGTSTVLTATAPAGSRFVSWSGACVGASSTCTVLMNSHKTATATFQVMPVYSVTFDSQGATVAAVPNVISVVYPMTTVGTLPTNPVRTGYIFGGWYTATNGGGTVFLGTTPVTKNIKVNAKWAPVPKTYSVSYNKGTATSGTTPSAQTKTESVNLTLATNSGNLARMGYTLTGWNTAANGSGTNYSIGGTYTKNANLTLYPKWSRQ